MDIRKVKKLIELLEESGIAEIEIKEGEEAVRISRNSSGSPSLPVQYMATPPPAIAESSAATPTTPVVEETEVISGHQVTSPMVGTFYESPSPGFATIC